MEQHCTLWDLEIVDKSYNEHFAYWKTSVGRDADGNDAFSYLYISLFTQNPKSCVVCKCTSYLVLTWFTMHKTVLQLMLEWHTIICIFERSFSSWHQYKFSISVIVPVLPSLGLQLLKEISNKDKEHWKKP